MNIIVPEENTNLKKGEYKYKYKLKKNTTTHPLKWLTHQ